MELLEQQAREAAELSVSPAEFGWPENTQFLVLDLSRIRDGATQQRIVGAARGCVGCEEMRAHPRKSIVGIRMSTHPAELKRAIQRSSIPLEYVWFSKPTPRLFLVPLNETSPRQMESDIRR